MMRRLPVVFALVLSACGPADLQLRNYLVSKQQALDGTGTAYRLLKHHDLAFVSDRQGVKIFRIGDEDFTQLSNIEVNPGVSADFGPLALDGSVLAAGHGVRVGLFDVSDPANPRPLSTIETQSTAVDLAFDGHWLYASGFNLRRVDVSDPAHPGELYPVVSQTVGRFIIGKGHLWASMPPKLQVFELPNDAIEHAAAQPVGAVDAVSAQALFFNGDALYGSSGKAGGVFVVDTRTPSAPTLTTPEDTVLFDGNGGGLALFGHQLIAPGTNGLTYVYDVSDPFTPKRSDARLLTRGYDDQPNYDVALYGEQILIAHQKGLLLYAPTLK